MSEHPIEGLMTTAMENLKEMIDVNTIIGDPVETPDGSVILTVSKVGFGFAAGGSEFSIDGKSKSGDAEGGKGGNDGGNGGSSKKQPFGGGSGGGVSITPIAFLIVSSRGIKMLHLDESTHLLDRLLDLAPGAIEKIQGMMKKNDQGNNQNNQGNGSNHKMDF
ncbi:GerW family sporulation protein [Rossellomorea aquimaris]|uniref:GerW family sporulation protein n=1 Tax=Rossellomorea aquimaris TaxID=189382 RepID=UPI001CD4DC10|nr:GerW family sporulation protein [Rossellomorea aquimaris]MCA1056904.1 GerW family sporulation protein [Rossellomorea aquimaris]